MPQLSDLIGKRKFVKKEYRPWDLSGTGNVDNPKNSADSIKPEPIANSEELTIPSVQPVEMVKSHNNIPGQLKTDNNSGNVSGNNQITTKKQPDNIYVTRSQQPSNNQVTLREQPDNIIDNNTGNTKGQAYLIDSIKKLVGIQKNIFLYIVNVCSARGALDTGNILSSDLANAASCSIGSAKTSLIRLLEKQLVIRLEGKASRGGHMLLSITKEIQAATIQAQHAFFNPLKLSQTGNITDNKLDNTIAYSSSSYKNNITTTVLPQEWKMINFQSLEQIGFSEMQLKQLWEKQLNCPEIIQESINHFAFALQNNPKVQAYSEPLNVLIGVLRKGQQWREPNYISPTDLALQKLLEDKKRIKENRDLMIKELIEIEFPEWKKKLTETQIQQIVPAEVFKMNVAAAITASLRTYYVDNILLPQLKKEGLLEP